MVGCTLDTQAAREQSARYSAIGRHVQSITRTDHSLAAALDGDVDRPLLEQLIATERACCPFFTIAFDGETLSYATEHAEALDVIEEALRR